MTIKRSSIILFLILLALPTVFSLQTTYQNEFGIIELTSNTNYCLMNCESIVKVCTIGETSLNENNFDLWFVDGKNNELARMEEDEYVNNKFETSDLGFLIFKKPNKLKNYDLSFGIETTFYEEEPIYETESKCLYDSNLERDYCREYGFIVGYNQVAKKEIVWDQWNPLEDPKTVDGCIYIKISGVKEPNENIDWKFNMFGLEPDWAWWNGTYPFRYSIINSYTTNEYVISVNDTGGLNGTIYWSKIGNSSYAYYNNVTGTWAIANETDEKQWENATSMDGNDVSGLWGTSAGGQTAIAMHFEEGTGTRANDSTSQHNDGDSWTNTPTWTSGVFGYGIDIDTNDYISIDDANSLDMKNEISLCAWVNVDSDPSTSDMPVIAKWNTGGGGSWSYLLSAGSQGGFRLHNGSNFVQISDVTWTGADCGIGLWCHICGVWNGTYASMWVNGTKVGEDTDCSSEIGVNVLPIYLGNDGYGNDFVGQFDEIRIYNRTLTEEEIVTQFKNGINQLTSLGVEEENVTATTTSTSTTTTTPVTTTTIVSGVICPTDNIYGDDPDADGSATWLGGYTNVFDGSMGTSGSAGKNDWAYANYTMLLGKSYNVTFKLETASCSGSGCDPKMSWYMKESASWNNTDDVTTSYINNTGWAELLGNYGFSKLRVEEENEIAGRVDYEELYIDQYCLLTFRTSDNITSVEVFDESLPNDKLDKFDLQIYNSSISQNYDDAISFIGSKADTPTGDVTLVIDSSGYGTRVFYEDILTYSYSNLTYYLVAETEGEDVDITVVDSLDQPVVSATVKIIANIGGNEIIVSEKTTDASGSISEFLSQTREYIFELSKSGYASRNYTLTPTNSPYILRLYTSDYEQLNWLYGYIFEGFEPDFAILGNNTFRYKLFDWNNTLEYWEFNVSYNGTVISSKYNDTLSGGGIMNTTIDLTGYTGNITLTGRFKSSYFSEHTTAKTYFIYDYLNVSYYSESNYTINETLTRIKEAEELKTNPTVQLGIGLLIILFSIGAGAVANTLDTTGNGSASSVVMLMVLAILSFVMGSVFGWGYYILTALSVIMLLVMKSNV